MEDGEKRPKGGRKGKGNKASEWKESAENITMEDVIDFYANNNEELKKLQSLKKGNSRDQTDYSKQREDYKIKIRKSGAEKWILLRLEDISGLVSKKINKKINKPYSEPWFKKFLEELLKLIEKYKKEK